MQPELRKTILLVEDLAIIAMAEANTLKKNGFDVIVAYTGNEAIKVASENPNIDLILMDVDLGKGMDGTEAAQIILKLHELPIVFLSNHIEKEVVEKTEKITSYGYVVKNSGETVLITSIKMAFKLFEAHTLRLESESKLLVSDNKFHTLEKQIDDVIWTMDMNFRFTYVSPSVEKMYGYTADQMMRLNLQDYLTPESVQKSINALADEISRFINEGVKENIVTLELEQIRKDKLVFPAEIRARFLLDKDNNPVEIIGVTRDITSRKSIEDALKKNQNKISSIFRAAPIGIGVTSNKIIVELNDYIYKMLGYAPEELIGKSAHKLYPTQEEFEFVDTEKYNQIEKSGIGTVETKWKRKDGSLVDILLSSTPLNLKDIFGGVTFTAQNITERKLAEEKLKLSEENYRRFFEEDLSGVFLSTPESGLKECNQAYVNMLEYDSIEDLLNSNPVSHYLESQQRTDFLNLLHKERKLTNYEGELLTKKGRLIQTLENINGVFDDEDNLVEFWGYVNDITDRKNAEQLLKNAAAEKEALHRELLHRVKNSMALIKALIYIEREQLKDPVASKVLEDLEMRIGTLSQMYSMLNASGVSDQIQLHDYIKQITASLSESYIEDKERINVDVFCDELSVSPKAASSIGLIVNELLTNSLKYAFPQDRKGNINVNLIVKDKTATIEISDDGVGLPKDYNIEQSAGMGTQLVKMLVQQLEGSISVESNNGAKVIISFPMDI